MTIEQPSVQTSYRGILRLAGPLILTTSGLMVMQFIDALFLSWYSADALAAVIPAGMASWLLISGFQGTAMYTSTFVAQYTGAGMPQRAATTVWQGIYFSVFSGVLVGLCALGAGPLFKWVGHAAEMRSGEVVFFTISCWGAFFSVLGAAVSGFFAGRNDTRTVMIAQVIGLAVNGILDWLLIFGKLGFPALGIAGAAWATVIAQIVVCFIFLFLFFSPGNRRKFGTWKERAFDLKLMKRFIAFGLPSGMRGSVEMLAWTMFLFFVGRIGTKEMVITSIAWRINGIAFFPIIGMAQAVSILVGNAQGQKRPDFSSAVTWRGLLMAEGWMIFAGLMFVCFPRELYGLFYSSQAMTPEYFAQVSAAGVIILRFVALYSLLDALNLVIVASLQSAGDTRWTMAASILMHLLFLSALWFVDLRQGGLMVDWIVATVFVMTVASMWLVRFLWGRWKNIQVIEHREEALIV